ncbi:MAG: hypothetical protein K2N95_15060, partial [Lachnospiraceae bacterium]|nr:hypothetical protein [Lachnospiraceae bacterium]
DNIVLTGLIAVTVYAQFFSLLYKVGFVANGFLFLICIAALVFWRNELTSCLVGSIQKNTWLHTVLRITLIIFWSYCTSRGYIHYDSDLYHAQSIRWIEEYGIVKGLGNIHVRFAYNSSFFALSALYSMKFLLKQSLHTVNGFLALILSFEVLKLKEITVRKKVLLSDFARIGAFFISHASMMRLFHPPRIMRSCASYF